MEVFTVAILTNSILRIYYVQLTQATEWKQIRKAHFPAFLQMHNAAMFGMQTPQGNTKKI